MTSVDTQLVEIGMKAWALDLERSDLDAHQIKGGVVVAIETDVDQDTGEIQRRFITAEPWQGRVRFDAINAADVHTVEPMNVAGIRALIRAAARVVADSKRVMTTDEARLITLMNRLMEVLG